MALRIYPARFERFEAVSSLEPKRMGKQFAQTRFRLRAIFADDADGQIFTKLSENLPASAAWENL